MRANVFRFTPESGRRATWSACPFRAQKQTSHTATMLIHHDEVALARAPPSLWGDYAAGKVN